MQYVISTIFIFLFCFPAWGTTLFDCDWATATGCGGAAVRDGALLEGATPGSDPAGLCTAFNVAYDATLGRNYLKVTDVGNCSINGASSISSPSTLYLRFWIKIHKWGGQNQHPLWINNAKGGGQGVCIFRSYTNGFGFVQAYNPYDMWDDVSACYNRSWNYTGASPTVGELQLDTWYRIEYKFEGVNTDAGTITVKIDGTDVTYYCIGADSGGCRLTQRAGTLLISPMNYVFFSIYDSAGGDYFSIAGLTIADDDWIGDEESATPAVSGNGVGGSGVCY